MGLDLYKSIKQDILDLIYEEKNINEVFFENEDVFDSFEVLFKEYVIHFESPVYYYHTLEGSIMVPGEEVIYPDNFENKKEITINI